MNVVVINEQWNVWWTNGVWGDRNNYRKNNNNKNNSKLEWTSARSIYDRNQLELNHLIYTYRGTRISLCHNVRCVIVYLRPRETKINFNFVFALNQLLWLFYRIKVLFSFVCVRFKQNVKRRSQKLLLTEWWEKKKLFSSGRFQLNLVFDDYFQRTHRLSVYLVRIRKLRHFQFAPKKKYQFCFE